MSGVILSSFGILFRSMIISLIIWCYIIYPVNCVQENGYRESPLAIRVLQQFRDEGSASKTKCDQDIDKILHGFTNHEFWSLRIVDASGDVGPGFVWGSNFLLGSQVACESSMSQQSLGISHQVESLHSILGNVTLVSVTYQVFLLNFTSAHQIDVQFNVRPFIHLGLCLPTSCVATEFYPALEKYFENYYRPSDPSVVAAVMYHKEGLNEKWVILKIPEFYILCLIGVASISLSLISGRMSLREEVLPKSMPGNSDNVKENFSKIFSCFSIKDNSRQLFSTATHAREIRPINGIRTIACLWIVILHTNIYSRFTNGSIAELQHLMLNSGIFMRFLMYGIATVDSFFVVSGFLLVYNFLNNKTLQELIQGSSFTKSLLLFSKLVMHRYLRLTPLLIVTMIGIRLTNKYLDQSSLFDVRTNIPDLQCSANMILLNLVYGQDLGHGLFICGSWLWYLANDMQYYIIFLALLFVYAKNPLFAKTIFTIITLAALGATFAICYLNGFTLQSDVMYRLFTLTYTAPHIRVIPFQGGVMMGYLAHFLSKNPYKTNKTVIRILWIIAIAYLLAPIALRTDVDKISSLICSLGYSLGKLVYGISVSGLIILCLVSSEGLIPKILSHGLFVHLNKLCYSVFLAHPVLIIFLFGMRTQPVYLGLGLLVTYALAIALISYGTALFMHILVELPFVRMSSLLNK